MRPTNFVQALSRLYTVEFEAKSGKNPFGRGLFTSYHVLRISIFGTICPAEFFQNFKSDFAFLALGVTFLNFFQNKKKFILNTYHGAFDGRIFFEKSHF